MKKKIRSFIILAALSAAAIHMINKILCHLSTLHDLLHREEGETYEWRFGKIHYQKYGCGKPLLLLHDLNPAVSSAEWSQAISLLSREHTVYTVDLLGCGLSDKPNLTYTNFLYVQMISDFIKHIIHEPADVIASGSAAPLVAMTVTAGQELIDKMIFVNPQNLHDLAKIPSKRSKLLYHFVSMPLVGTFLYNILFCRKRIALKLRESFYDPSQMDDLLVDTYLESAHLDKMHSRYLFASISGNYTKVNLAPFLSKITHSIFIITGAESTHDNETACEYQKYLPSIEIVTISDTKSLPQIENPEEFCEQVDILLDPK